MWQFCRLAKQSNDVTLFIVEKRKRSPAHYCERPEKRWGACRRCCPRRWGVVGEVGVVGVVGLEGAVHLGKATSVSYCLQLVPQIAHTIRAQSTHPSLPCSKTNKQATMLCFFMRLCTNIDKKIGQVFLAKCCFYQSSAAQQHDSHRDTTSCRMIWRVVENCPKSSDPATIRGHKLTIGCQ